MICFQTELKISAAVSWDLYEVAFRLCFLNSTESTHNGLMLTIDGVLFESVFLFISAFSSCFCEIIIFYNQPCHGVIKKTPNPSHLGTQTV